MNPVVRQFLERAQEFLAAAQDNLDARRCNVAHEDARTAAELAGKALLQHASGSHPRRHAIGGDLHQLGLLPPDIDARAVARLLKERTRADYGFGPVDAADAAKALGIADALLRHAVAATGRVGAAPGDGAQQARP